MGKRGWRLGACVGIIGAGTAIAIPVSSVRAVENGTATIVLDKQVDSILTGKTVADFNLQVIPVTVDWASWSGEGDGSLNVGYEDLTEADSALVNTPDPSPAFYPVEAASVVQTVDAPAFDPENESQHGATFLITEAQLPGFRGGDWEGTTGDLSCGVRSEFDGNTRWTVNDRPGDHWSETSLIELFAGDVFACKLDNTFLDPNLTLAKSVSPAAANAGDDVTYTLTVKNTGGPILPQPDNKELVGETLAGVPDFTLTDAMPDGFTIVGPLPAGCTGVGTALLECTFDTALVDQPDEVYTFDVIGHIDADNFPGTYTNIAYIDLPNYDPLCFQPGFAPTAAQFEAPCDPDCHLPGDSDGDWDFTNVACADVEVGRLGTIGITLDDDTPDGFIDPGGTYNYTLTVTNNGPSTLRQVELLDDFPDYLTVNSVTPGAGWTCNQSDPLTCTIDKMYPSTSTPVVVNVTVSPTFDGNEIPDHASVSALWDKPVIEDDQASIRASVASGPFATSANADNLINVRRAVVTTTTTEAPTTTSTTTTTTTTTVAPTIPPSTAAVQPPPLIDLPSTGATSSGPLTLALVLSGLGAGLVVVATRRRSA